MWPVHKTATLNQRVFPQFHRLSAPDEWLGGEGHCLARQSAIQSAESQALHPGTTRKGLGNHPRVAPTKGATPSNGQKETIKQVFRPPIIESQWLQLDMTATTTHDTKSKYLLVAKAQDCHSVCVEIYVTIFPSHDCICNDCVMIGW